MKKMSGQKRRRHDDDDVNDVGGNNDNQDNKDGSVDDEGERRKRQRLREGGEVELSEKEKKKREKEEKKKKKKEKKEKDSGKDKNETRRRRGDSHDSGHSVTPRHEGKETTAKKTTAATTPRNRHACTGSDGSPPPSYFRKKMRLAVSLMPATLHDVRGNIDRSLSNLLLKYSDGVGGILLAYENVRVGDEQRERDRGVVGVDTSKVHKNTGHASPSLGGGGYRSRRLENNGPVIMGSMMHDFPYIHYDVTCDALVFSPSVESRLSASITESSFPSHLSLLVHRYFNASIPAENMRSAGYDYDPAQESWYYRGGTTTGQRQQQQNDDDDGRDGPADESNRVMLAKDDVVHFTVEKIYESGGIISMDGRHPSLSR